MSIRKNTTTVVDKISAMDLKGNVIPNTWFVAPALRFPSGAVNMAAVLILSEIVFWYRSCRIDDEATGKTIEIRKKFAADKLQRSYAALAEKFGLSKRQSTDACHFLQNNGLITIELRTVRVKYGDTGSEVPLSNVVFLEPVVEAIERITYPSSPGDPPTLERESAPTLERESAPTLERETYTDISTENSTESRKSKPSASDKSSAGESEPTGNLVLVGENQKPPSKKKQPKTETDTDPRFKPFIEDFKTYWETHQPGIKFVFNGLDGKQLNKFLKDAPGVDRDLWLLILSNRAKSDGVVHTQQLGYWIGKAMDYASGPLTQFKSVKGNIDEQPQDLRTFSRLDKGIQRQIAGAAALRTALQHDEQQSREATTHHDGHATISGDIPGAVKPDSAFRLR